MSGTFYEDVLSLQQSKMLQGFIIVMIMCHHLSQKVSAHWLELRYYRPGLDYFVEIGYQEANPYAWYAIILPLFYLFYYFAFRFCKSTGLAISIVWGLVFIYMILGTYINHNDYLITGEWWYNSVLAIALFRSSLIATNTISYYYNEVPGRIIASWGTVWRRWVCLAFQMLAALMFCFAFDTQVKSLYYIKKPLLYVIVVTVLALGGALIYKKVNDLVTRWIIKKN